MNALQHCSSPQSCLPSPRPFLKWAGGKSRLISQYQAYFPTHYHRYLEPFLGGAAIFFHLCPPNAIISDINPDLVNVYRCVQRDVEALIARLTTHARHHCQEYYYELRAKSPKNSIEQAARTIYLNKTCFNGLYRLNAKGGFNVPMGRYKKPRICDPDLLRAASQALQGCEIRQQSFQALRHQQITSQDFIYFDPPYYPLSPTSKFTSYSREAFTAADQIELRNVFAELAQQGASIMLSNSDCEFIRELYQGFQIYPITAARSINSNPQKRGKIQEVLITSYQG
jgi:DNA adenine methylase